MNDNAHTWFPRNEIFVGNIKKTNFAGLSLNTNRFYYTVAIELMSSKEWK